MVLLSCDVLFPRGPGVSEATLEREAGTTKEVRTRTSPDASGRWTVRVEEETPEGLSLQTSLVLSREDRGIVLHELFNAKRGTVATFSPPLLMMPADIHITPDVQPVEVARSAVRLVEGEGTKQSTRSARARTALRVTESPGGRSVWTVLDLSVGPALIRRVAEWDLTRRDERWEIVQERRDFSVRAGPLVIEQDRVVATPF